MHYADDVSVCSPLVKRRLKKSDGWLHGKYLFRRGVQLFEKIHVDGLSPIQVVDMMG